MAGSVAMMFIEAGAEYARIGLMNTEKVNIPLLKGKVLCILRC